jgi:hypothetical protein
MQPNLGIISDEIQDVTNCVQFTSCDRVIKNLHKTTKVKS